MKRIIIYVAVATILLAAVLSRVSLCEVHFIDFSTEFCCSLEPAELMSMHDLQELNLPLHDQIRLRRLLRKDMTDGRISGTYGDIAFDTRARVLIKHLAATPDTLFVDNFDILSDTTIYAMTPVTRRFFYERCDSNWEWKKEYVTLE